jgi:2-dehydro-3-deoxygluconokinase
MPELTAMTVAAIGECMIEFRSAGGDRYALGYGGDTFNTAVYLRRLGVPVAYGTALGDDPFSSEIIALCRNEGIEVDLIVRVPHRLPGIYLIRTDAAGERSFFYWRDVSPARRLFDLPGSADLIDRLQQFSMIYLSGITLSLYSDVGRRTLFKALDAVRRRGGRIAFDSNYRPLGWPDADAARSAFTMMMSRIDIALPTLDDERLLFGDDDAAAIVRRYRSAGAGEVVVKDGPKGCTVADGGETVFIPTSRIVAPVDTTAAGDSFNAGYLAARLAGATAAAAARAGHDLAAVVIQHPGAIIPHDLMPAPRPSAPRDPHGRAR